MAITRLGSTDRFVEILNGTGSAGNLAAESGWQAGDLDLIAVSWYDNGSATLSTPSGYTRAGSADYALIDASTKATLFYKVLDGTEGASSIQFSSNAYANAVRLTLRGASALEVVSGSFDPGTAANGTTVTSPDIVGSAGQMLLCPMYTGDPATFSTPADMTAGPWNSSAGTDSLRWFYQALSADAGSKSSTLSITRNNRGVALLAQETGPAVEQQPPLTTGDPASDQGIGGDYTVGGTDEPAAGGDAVVANAASATAASTVAGTQAHAGDVANAASAATASTPAGTQTHAGAVSNAASATAASTPAGTVAVQGAVANAASATTATTAAGTQTHIGTVSNAASATAASSVAGTQAHAGAVANAASATAASTPAGTTTVTGSSARTVANDSASAAGTTAVLGASSRTNADDTSSASGSVGGAVSGTAAVANVSDTTAASGTTAVAGAAAVASGNDTATASGAAGAVSGTVSATGGDDTSAASGVADGGQQAGGWGQSSNRKPRDYTPSAEQIHAERVRLGILPAEEAPAAVAESAPVSSSAPAAAKPLAVPSLSRVEIDAAAIVAANEAIRAAIAAAQQQELSRLVWESVQQDEAAVVALIAELV